MSSNIVFVVSEAISGHRVDLKYQVPLTIPKHGLRGLHIFT